MHQRLERIYREHRQGLFTLALAITRCPQSAEDAVHDAFVRLWRSRLRPGGDPVAYVFASVRNAALDVLRRRRTTVELTDTIFASRQDDPSCAAAQSEEAALLRAAGRDFAWRPAPQTAIAEVYLDLTELRQCLSDSAAALLPPADPARMLTEWARSEPAVASLNTKGSPQS